MDQSLPQQNSHLNHGNLQQSKDTLKQLIVFKVDTSEYAIPIEVVREVIRIRPIKKLPKTPSYVLGVMNLRGNIIPIISLREKFGYPPKELNTFTRIIVFNHDSRIIGIVVDEVNKSITVKQDDYTQNPELIQNHQNRDLIKSIVKPEDSLYFVLELDNLLFSISEGILQG